MRLMAEEAQIVVGIVPVDLAGATGGVGDWVSLKLYRHLAVVVVKAAGGAGEAPIVTMLQATDVSGANSKALPFTRVDVKSAADIFTVGQFTKVTQAAGNTYTPAAGNTQAVYLIEFNSEDLDVEGGFDCVKASIADVGATAQIATALYILTEPRYTPPPSAIVD